MIKISKLADYAISIAQSLMLETESQSAAKIAKKTLIPEPTVSKILKRLTDADVLLSIQGPKGGYKLAKIPEEISLAELITAIDGKPAMTECCKPAYDCARENVCGQRNHWRKINHLVFSVLDGVSLKEMTV